MANNYDNIAPYYDHLNKLVLGKATIDAQNCLVPFIRENSRLLIVGGGTGKILEEIAKQKANLQIVYVDSSGKMIAIAKKRRVGSNNVTFVQGKIEEFLSDD